MPEQRVAESLTSGNPALESRTKEKVGILPENIAAAVAYLTFVPAVVFLLLDPFRRNRFVRFHALQCLLCWGAAIVLVIVLKLGGDLVFLIPTAGPLFVTIIDGVAALATLFVWLVLLVKAIQGERFRLPVLGNFAEQYSERSPSA